MKSSDTTKYIITHKSVFVEKILDDNSCEHSYVDSYTTSSLNACKDILVNIIDAPKKLMTIEDVFADFSSHEYPISENDAQSILEYYNKRYELLKMIEDDLGRIDNDDYSFNYSLPVDFYKFNSSDSCDVSQLNASITLSVSKN